MAKASNVNTRVWADEFAISGYINTAEQSLKQELPVVTALSDTGPRRGKGNYDHTLSFAGFFDGADNAYDERAYVDLNTDEDHYFACCFGANAAGSVVYETIGRLSDQSRKAAVGEAILLDISVEGSGGLGRGVVLFNGTLSGDGNQTGQLQGVTTTPRQVVLTVRVISGSFTSFDAHVEESQQVDGNPDAFADVVGLAITGINAVGVYRDSVTVTTEAYKRLVISNWVGTSAVVVATLTEVAGT